MGPVLPARTPRPPSASVSLKSRTRKLSVRRRLRLRDGDGCHWCGRRLRDPETGRQARPDDATIDHVLPRSRGGGNLLSNLVLACPACNEERGDARDLLSLRPWLSIR